MRSNILLHCDKKKYKKKIEWKKKINKYKKIYIIRRKQQGKRKINE
jgi:hypothetical protein